MSRFRKNKRLGVADTKGRYDLPLNKSAGSNFMIVLVALMTFLAMMALSATFLLNSVTHHWSSGLENSLTIEIPATDKLDKLRSQDDIDKLSTRIKDTLLPFAEIDAVNVLSRQEIQDLVSPWLGEDLSASDMPLPGLISVQLNARNAEGLKSVEDAVEAIASDIKIDTHETWLNDILRLAGTLKISASLVTLIIGLTTITAIAGAIRSRMAEHRDDIELLHLMGASDMYITKQLQRHALILTIKGSIFGLTAGLVIIGLMTLIGSSDAPVMPGLSFSVMNTAGLLLLPLAISFIAWITARFTVLRVLGQMP